MANITRTDLFRDVARFDPFRDFDGFLGFPRLSRLLDTPEIQPVIKLDVSEDEKTYRVKAELPGVKKEDIAVEIDGNQVSLSAEVKRESEKKEGETVVHSERYYGRQSRTFTLGREIDRAKAEAKFDNGVLELTLPKNGAPAKQRLAIK